jgi:hypothetical protein
VAQRPHLPLVQSLQPVLDRVRRPYWRRVRPSACGSFGHVSRGLLGRAQMRMQSMGHLSGAVTGASATAKSLSTTAAPTLPLARAAATGFPVTRRDGRRACVRSLAAGTECPVLGGEQRRQHYEFAWKVRLRKFKGFGCAKLNSHPRQHRWLGRHVVAQCGETMWSRHVGFRGGCPRHRHAGAALADD